MIGCYCPHCFQAVEFDPNQAGYMIPCPECGELVRVPGRLAARSRARLQFRHVAPKKITGMDLLGLGGEFEPADVRPRIRCTCPHCLRVLRVPPGAPDEVHRCPACDGGFTIPPELATQAVQSVEFDQPAVPGERPRAGSRKRRRKPRDYRDEWDQARRDQEEFARGRTIALVVTLCLLLLTVVDLISFMLTGTSAFRKSQSTEVETTVLLLVFLGLAVVLRIICLVGLFTAQNWARIMLGLLLMLSALCGIFTTLRGGGIFGIIQMLLNLGFGVVLLGSPSLAAYTRG